MRYAIYILMLLLLSGCAVSPEEEARREQKLASIAEVLEQSVGVEELGEDKRCLSEHEYRSFRALGDRHMLFEGRRDRLWVNTLRTRCHDLRYGDVLIVRSFSTRRLCNADTFQVTDWFDWPWYRRWPWHWRAGWGTGPVCSLGDFRPVTEEQVAEIEAIIRGR